MRALARLPAARRRPPPGARDGARRAAGANANGRGAWCATPVRVGDLVRVLSAGGFGPATARSPNPG